MPYYGADPEGGPGRSPVGALEVAQPRTVRPPSVNFTQLGLLAVAHFGASRHVLAHICAPLLAVARFGTVWLASAFTIPCVGLLRYGAGWESENNQLLNPN